MEVERSKIKLKSFSKSNPASIIAPLLVVAGTFGGIGKYGFMDDYTILESSTSGSFNFEIYMSQGRPFSAIYSYFIFSFINDIDSLIYLHILGSLTLAFFAWLLTIYFRETIQNSLVLTSIAVIPILVTPGLLLVSAWAVMSSIGISLFTSVFAAFLMRKSTLTTSFPVLTLLIVSFLSYPPSAAIFICLPCVAWLLSVTRLSKFENQKELMITVKRSVISILIAGLVSLLLLKFISSQYGQTSNRTELIGDVPTKMNFLFKSAIPTALDYFEPNWGFSFYGWFTLVLVLCLFLFCKSAKEIFCLILVLSVGIGSTLAPITLTAENWPSNRALFASQWLLSTLTLIAIFLLLTSLKQTPYKFGLLQIVSPILILVSVFHSNNLLITTMKTPQLEELSLVRSAIAQVDPTSRIEVRKSEWLDSLAPWVVGDEFGIPSTCQPWVPVPLSKLILNEKYPTRTFDVLLVEETKSSNSVDFSRVLNPSK